MSTFLLDTVWCSLCKTDSVPTSQLRCSIQICRTRDISDRGTLLSHTDIPDNGHRSRTLRPFTDISDQEHRTPNYPMQTYRTMDIGQGPCVPLQTYRTRNIGHRIIPCSYTGPVIHRTWTLRYSMQIYRTRNIWQGNGIVPCRYIGQMTHWTWTLRYPMQIYRTSDTSDMDTEISVADFPDQGHIVQGIPRRPTQLVTLDQGHIGQGYRGVP